MRLSYKNRACQNLCFLAKSTTWNRGSFSTYILISYKIAKKGKPCGMDLPHWKTISQPIEPLLKWQIYSRTHKLSSGCDMVWISGKFNELIFGSYCRYPRLRRHKNTRCYLPPRHFKSFWFVFLRLTKIKLVYDIIRRG